MNYHEKSHLRRPACRGTTWRWLGEGRGLLRPDEGGHVSGGEPGEVRAGRRGALEAGLEDEVEEHGENDRHQHHLEQSRRELATAHFYLHFRDQPNLVQ